MFFLEVENLKAYYGKAQALKGVTLDVEKGQCIGIVGPNGAGKSTLLDSIIGLTHWEGEIIFDGVSLRGLRPREIIKLGIGYSTERGNLFSYMSVRDNLLVGAYLMRNKINDCFTTVFKIFPLLYERQKQKALTLSGGERQMLSLGRAFMSNPRLLLLDEPTLGLAPVVISKIGNAIEDLKKEGVSIIIAEQNVNFASKYAEKLYLLEGGRIVMEGNPQVLSREEYVSKTYFGI